MRIRALFLLILILGGGVAVYAALQQKLKQRAFKAPPPRLLPDFPVSNIRGETQSLRELVVDQPSLLLFVKPECSYCHSQLAGLARAAEQLQKFRSEASPLAPITVVVETSGLQGAELKEFEARFSPPFKICFDQRNEGMKQLGVAQLPFALIIDGEGLIRKILIGERDPDFLLKALDSLINTAPAERRIDPLFAATAAANSGGVYMDQEGVVFQRAENDCAAAALKMIFDHHEIAGSLDDLTRELIDRRNGTSMLKLKLVAEKAGLSAEGWRIAERDLPGVPLPSIVLLDRNHYVVLEAVEPDGRVVYADPALGRVRAPIRTFLQKSRGEMLLIRKLS